MEKNNIRNFVIISHVNHGKSTLADRFLELTKTVSKEKMRPQYLDMMDLEREKGITIKMQPVRMTYILNSRPYILNLIDTPGHVDFNYEVSRSLAAVEGAILLVDASKGIQAQTIGNLELAREQNLVIIPVINKIDLTWAKIEETEREITDLLKINPQEIIKVSAKESTNVEKVLDRIIKKIPMPDVGENKELKALIFDSKYDPYKGVLAFVRIFEGEVKTGDKIYLLQAGIESQVKEVGVFKPQLSAVAKLTAGEIGFIATGIKIASKVKVGETIASNPETKPLPGYQEPQPKVFLSIYPENFNESAEVSSPLSSRPAKKTDAFELLKSSLEKLKLTDASLDFKPELKEGLGRGFQTGFLGLLHAEIISERLKREFGLNIVLSTPSVIYKVVTQNGKERFIYTSADWPERSQISLSQELWVKLQILTPLSYLGQVTELLGNMESRYQRTNYLGTGKAELIYEMPLREIITKNFYDKLKSISQGFASMNYQILDWRPADLVKLDILILGKKEEIFSRIVPTKEAYQEGERIIRKLKETLPAQLFPIPLQAAIGGKIIARETIKARRRDVTAPLYGGDYTRKRKLLEKQKKGKKELAQKGKIRIPAKVFLEIFKNK